MNITLTNNFYRYLATMIFGNSEQLNQSIVTNTRQTGACYTFGNLVDRDGNEYTRAYWGSGDNDKFNSMGAVSNAKTSAYSQLRFDIGSDATAPTKADTNITALAYTDYSTVTHIQRFVDGNNAVIKYTVTISNTGTADLTFAEIGMLKSLLTDTVSTRKDFLFGRVVVGETTITPNSTKSFIIEITQPL